MMLSHIGPLEIGMILVVALVVFGPKRLPDFGRSLGQGVREFKQSVAQSIDGEVADANPIEPTRAEPSPRSG